MRLIFFLFIMASPWYAFTVVSTTKVSGLHIGKKIQVDAEYFKVHPMKDKKESAYFSIILPKDDLQNTFVAYPPKISSIFEASFATSEKKLIEKLQFIGMNLTPKPLEERQEILKKFLAGLLSKVSKGYKEVKGFAYYPLKKEGKWDAYVLDGYSTDPKLGVRFVKLVSFFQEGKKKGIAAVAFYIKGTSSITHPKELKTKGRMTKVLDSFEFL